MTITSLEPHLSEAIAVAANLAADGVAVLSLIAELEKTKRPRGERGWGVTVAAEAENRRVIVTDTGNVPMAYRYGTRVTNLRQPMAKPDSFFSGEIGKVYGHITVSGIHHSPDHSGRRLVLAHCVCGRAVLRTPYNLRAAVAAGFKPHCGCRRRKPTA